MQRTRHTRSHHPSGHADSPPAFLPFVIPPGFLPSSLAYKRNKLTLAYVKQNWLTTEYQIKIGHLWSWHMGLPACPATSLPTTSQNSLHTSEPDAPSRGHLELLIPCCGLLLTLSTIGWQAFSSQMNSPFFSALLCASRLTPTDRTTGLPRIQSTGGRTGDLGAQELGFSLRPLPHYPDAVRQDPLPVATAAGSISSPVTLASRHAIPSPVSSGLEVGILPSTSCPLADSYNLATPL